MLDRSRDADGEVQLGRDDLARLADLQVVVGVAGINGRARGADGFMRMRMRVSECGWVGGWVGYGCVCVR